MGEQSNAAAERSGHVLRGAAPRPSGQDPFSGPFYGPVQLRSAALLTAVEAVLANADVLTHGELVEALEDALRARV